MKQIKVLCVIPARYASTRLPGKPLLDIAGKPMVEHTYRSAQMAQYVDEVVVATDDERIFSAVEKFGGKAMMTLPTHASGTDRLAEVAQKYNDVDVLINVQGDEPLIDPAIIDRLVQVMLAEPMLEMATVKTLMDETEYNNPAAVKVVTDKEGYALYFSRSLIPYPRNEDNFAAYKHIGLYAYRKDFLLKFSSLPQGILEQIEGLEQLRALENGSKIKVLAVDSVAIGVDTEEDLQEVRKILEKTNG